MPFTPDMRRKVDQIRDYLYGGGYPDPLTNAEQLSFLFFFYMVEGLDSINLRQARATARPYKSLFAGDWTLRNPRNAPEKGVETIPRERMRWSSWANAMAGEQLVIWVRDEVFPFFAEIGDTYGMSFMAQARLAIDEPTVFTQIVTLVNGLRLEQADPDTKGDLFEHVLRQIKQAGELGQFRTPRHIIRSIVDLVDPRIGETVYDPAAELVPLLPDPRHLDRGYLFHWLRQSHVIERADGKEYWRKNAARRPIRHTSPRVGALSLKPRAPQGRRRARHLPWRFRCPVRAANFSHL
jgi:type I restriction enzyme M protein